MDDDSMTSSPPPVEAGSERSASCSALTREDVIAAFERLLGRSPESEATISSHLRLLNHAALDRVIRTSAEFRLRGAEGVPEPLASDRAHSVVVHFGRGGDAEPMLRKGWATPDLTSRWTVGTSSELELPVPRGAEGLDLALSVAVAPFHRAQRLSLCVEGRELAAAMVGAATTLGCCVPAALMAGRTSLHVTLHHPDATRPSDTAPLPDDRELGFAVTTMELERAPGATTAASESAEMLRCFQSLGETCEFGFVLQRFDRGGSGLMRFSGLPFDQLLRGLRTGFEGFPDRTRMRVERHPTRTGGIEAMIVEDGFRFITHSGVSDTALQGETDRALLARECMRLGFLRRLFLEEVREGQTIFVHHTRPAREHAEMVALWLALRRLGSCTLLWVVEAQPGLPPGSVLELGEGFFKGFIGRLAPRDNAEGYDLDGWLTLCRRVLRLSSAGQVGSIRDT